MSNKIKILFVCTANVSRSRTAEDIFKQSPESMYEVQSAGIRHHPLGGQVLTQDLINWADRIFVMDERRDGHLSFIRARFDYFGKDIYVLDIKDVYERGNPALIELLKERLLSIGGIKI